jgi:hypothetical protein
MPLPLTLFFGEGNTPVDLNLSFLAKRIYLIIIIGIAKSAGTSLDKKAT